MKTAVVVDDFRSIRVVVKSVLTKEGFEIIEAENGKEALALFDGRKIDILITDVDMPIMDGISLAKEVGQLPLYSNLPIIILTTNSFERKEDEMDGIRITGWIKKPFDFNAFKDLISKNT